MGLVIADTYFQAITSQSLRRHEKAPHKYTFICVCVSLLHCQHLQSICVDRWMSLTVYIKHVRTHTLTRWQRLTASSVWLQKLLKERRTGVDRKDGMLVWSFLGIRKVQAYVYTCGRLYLCVCKIYANVQDSKESCSNLHLISLRLP